MLINISTNIYFINLNVCVELLLFETLQRLFFCAKNKEWLWHIWRKNKRKLNKRATFTSVSCTMMWHIWGNVWLFVENSFISRIKCKSEKQAGNKNLIPFYWYDHHYKYHYHYHCYWQNQFNFNFDLLKKKKKKCTMKVHK